MIFYFSGTGNSLYVAKNIGEKNEEKLVSIASAVNSNLEVYEYTLKESEVVGFVYPIYAWAPPKMVFEFIKKLKLNNYNNNYIFLAETFAGSSGSAVNMLKEALEKKNFKLNGWFSVVMPTNYIVVGNGETKESQDKKLKEAEENLKHINNSIKERIENSHLIKKEIFKKALTVIVNPLFDKFAVNTKKFYATDKCNGCKLCEDVCNCKTIKVQGKPVWGPECTQCFACINVCPTRAIQFGKGTENKTRYKNPNINVTELKIK